MLCCLFLFSSLLYLHIALCVSFFFDISFFTFSFHHHVSSLFLLPVFPHTTHHMHLWPHLWNIPIILTCQQQPIQSLFLLIVSWSSHHSAILSFFSQHVSSRLEAQTRMRRIVRKCFFSTHSDVNVSTCLSGNQIGWSGGSSQHQLLGVVSRSVLSLHGRLVLLLRDDSVGVLWREQAERACEELPYGRQRGARVCRGRIRADVDWQNAFVNGGRYWCVSWDIGTCRMCVRQMFVASVTGIRKI